MADTQGLDTPVVEGGGLVAETVVVVGVEEEMVEVVAAVGVGVKFA